MIDRLLPHSAEGTKPGRRDKLSAAFLETHDAQEDLSGSLGLG